MIQLTPEINKFSAIIFDESDKSKHRNFYNQHRQPIIDYLNGKDNAASTYFPYGNFAVIGTLTKEKSDIKEGFNEKELRSILELNDIQFGGIVFSVLILKQ